jgi:alpha-glucosidase
MPYLYSQFVIASEFGMPVQRPLCLEFPGDMKTWEIEDQFLLGAHLLVAPVLEPGCRERSSYLPRGIWYSWPDHQPYISEGAALMASSPLDRIPVWVRGGAVIPCWPETPLSTMDYHPEEIVLHVYLPEDGSQGESLLQEDDGLTDAHRTGKYFRTQFRIVREQDRFRLWTEVDGRGFPEFRRQRFRVFLHPPSGEHWVLEGGSVTDSGDWEIPNCGEEFELKGKRVE